MKNFLIKRLKNGLPYAILFFGMSIYFYVSNEYSLALPLFLASILLLISYFIFRKKKV